MATNEIKVNLDLMNALIKLREAEVMFNSQIKLISERSGVEYEDETESFSYGIYKCMDAITTMIGESVVNEVYDVIPNKP